MMDPHLSEDVIEALAHDRFDLAPSEAVGHVASCADCRARVDETRELSFSLRDALRGDARLDFDLDAIVQSAVAAGHAAPAVEPRRSLRAAQRPSRSALGLGIAAGLTVAALPVLVSRPELPSVGVAVDLMRAGRLVVSAIDGAVTTAVPGGWGLVMFAGIVALGILAVPAWRLATRRSAMPGSLLMSAASLALCLSFAPRASALEFEGELPEEVRLNLDVVQVPTSEALRRIATGAQLGLVVTLPEDPKVTVRVRKAPLREVLTAVLGDAPVLVKREGSLLIVRPAPSKAEPPATLPPSEAPLLAPAPPVPPTPPPPPALPRLRKGKGNDRVNFGGNSVIRRGERVGDVVTLGGNTTIYGVVEGDVVVIGGNTTIKRGAEVFGEIVAMGGNVDTERGARLHQDGDEDRSAADEAQADAEQAAEEAAAAAEEAAAEAEEAAAEADEGDGGVGLAGRSDDAEDHRGMVGVQHGGDRGGDDDEHEEEEAGWFADTLSSFSRHALLFVLGLVLLGAFPARLSGVTRAIGESPLRAGALGALGVAASIVLSIVLVITIIGIPAAIVLLIGSALALYAGLAATALVVGGALPLGGVRGFPIRELALGVLLLFILSQIPVVGAIALAVASAVGFGAILSTRFAAPAATVPPAPPAGEPPPPPVFPEVPPTRPEVV
jgi:hypothetical protein